MQMKHLIIFSLIGIVALLGFNVINGSQREKHREALISSAQLKQETTGAMASEADHAASSTVAVSDQPLGKQPKAILDNATSQIAQAQQSEQQRVEQIGSTQ